VRVVLSARVSDAYCVMRCEVCLRRDGVDGFVVR
jgi:hypothetical protein